MKAAILIIGPGNSGKSTIIRSLSGIKSSQWEKIIDKKTNKSMFVISSSPQENGNINDIFLEKELEEVYKDDKSLGIIIAIQPTKPRLRLSIEVVISLLKKHKIMNIHPFIIFPSYKGKDAEIDRIVKRLQAIGINSHTILDGRRFSFINAEEVLNIANIDLR